MYITTAPTDIRRMTMGYFNNFVNTFDNFDEMTSSLKMSLNKLIKDKTIPE